MKYMWVIIFVHQLVFQGLFALKNILLKKKSDVQIRGKNKEATIAIIVFGIFNLTSFVFSFSGVQFGKIPVLSDTVSLLVGSLFLILNLAVAMASLIHMGDSWRVGVVEHQQTELITTGIYRISRNPYFLSYMLMFVAYTVFLQNIVVLGLAVLGVICIHRMVMKEEAYLAAFHGETYLEYQSKVPRYFGV